MIGKRKREEDKEKREKINNGISKYFSAKATTKAPIPKVLHSVSVITSI